MSSGDAQPALLNAFLLTTKDALMVFEAARRGICPVVERRLQESEKSKLIVSGSVFAFDEQSTGIKRWTDGALWSPSRIIGNYLIYRELDKKGEKDAGRPSTQSGPSSIATSPHAPQSDPFEAKKEPVPGSSQDDSRPSTSIVTGSTGLHRELERALVGSLTTSYRFKKDGLIKKTISNGNLHLISYYTIDDVLAGRLRTPSSLIELASLEISSALLDAKNFRMPPVTEKDVDGTLRYIGEESDPIGAPPILAPLLAPGAVPAARPMSAIADVGYGLPPSGTVHSYEANDPHLFAYKPIDETAYCGPLAGEASTSQYQNEYHQYEPRRPDTAQPLWPQHVPEEAQPIAGPSNWREKDALPYVQTNNPPLFVPSQHHLPPRQYQQEGDISFRSALSRSYSGAPASPYHDQASPVESSRSLSQYRRQSYRPPTSTYPYPSRPVDPYPRHVTVRPATSPAPSPGMYATSAAFNGVRGPHSAKAESNSPGLQHAQHPGYHPPAHYPPVSAPEYPHYGPPGTSALPPQSYPTSYPPPAPQFYSTSSPTIHGATAHTAPPRTAPPFSYPGPPAQFYQAETQSAPVSMPQHHLDPNISVQSAPIYSDSFEQRSSYAGPVRQRIGPKREDPS